MTVCLAVLCKNSKAIVLAADRMLTAGDTEYEQDVRKVHEVTECCAVMTAGSALQQVDLIRNAQGNLHNHKHPSVIDVATELREQFVQIRRDQASQLHLQPLGLDFKAFLSLQDKLSENLILRLTRNIEQEQLKLQLVVAGYDITGAHIYYIGDPGVLYCYDAVGFCAIGSGEHHAELTFIRSAYSPNLPLNRAVFLAYQAKRDAEMAPGVGAKYTDIGVIDEDGLRFLEDEALDKLRSAYDRLMGRHRDGHGDTDAQVDALTLFPIEKVTKVTEGGDDGSNKHTTQKITKHKN